MQNFFNELWQITRSYYDGLVFLFSKFVLAIIVFTAFYIVSRYLRRVSHNRLSQVMDDPLLAKFISRFIGLSIIIIAVLLFLRIVGLGGLAIGILSTAGVGAFIIGFAFKDIGENFLAGFVMAFNRPFRVGDVVELNGHRGTVITLNLRDTHIKTFDGKDIYIPNGMVVKNPVINYTIDGYLRQEFKIGLDQHSNITNAMQIIRNTIENIKGVLKGDKSPSIAVSDLTSSTLVLTVYIWLDTFDKSISGIALKNEAVEKTLIALDKAGFYLPSDILEIKAYQDRYIPVKSIG